MNPCPCGFRGVRGSNCRCDDAAVQRYVGKPTPRHKPNRRPPCARVEAARARRAERFARDEAKARGTSTNAAIPAAAVRRLCPLDSGALALVESAVTRGALSARAFERIGREHVAEALVYRDSRAR